MGTLYLVSTPIGNLEDITQRALRVLREVDLIAAEDTRHTGKLLVHYAITTPMISYHEHNERQRESELLGRLSSGSVALVSDAGTPALSDPGYLLVRSALNHGHLVVPIPGPSAAIASLVASGLPTEAFLFLGFLPRKAGERRKLLQGLSAQGVTMVFFESPHRLATTLTDMQTSFGSDRQIAVCRELTKLHEQIHRGSLAEIRAEFEPSQPRGEITLVVAGAESSTEWDETSVRRAISKKIADGLRRSEAVRQVAAEAGWTRQAVYQLAESEE